MIKTIKHERPWWEEVQDTDTLTEEMFESYPQADGDTLRACNTNLGRFTTLDRMTGFGYRDIETGFKDPDGTFWLASGGYDLMSELPMTVAKAIEYVKQNANNCVALKNPPTKGEPK